MKKYFAIALSIVVLTGCFGPQRLDLKVGETVELTGKLSDIPWQHMIEIREAYPYINYIDFEGGDQRVVYTKDLIRCSNNVKFKGTVVEIVGESKNPDSNEVYVDQQITADEFECV